MARPRDDGGTVKTTDSVFAIIETLEELDGARISEVAAELDVANSTAYRHLSTLRNRGYVVKEGDEFYPGMRFLRLGQYVRERKKPYRLAASKVEELQ
jgi:DNA-binding IclR family transcriptional regulator